MKQPINIDNNDHLHMIRHFAHQAGSTPVHLDNESIRGLRNLHNLVHNEDVEHDFSKLKTLFAQPNIAIHLKSQIEKKKANGGVINDYINTLKHNGSGENSELSLVPNELVKFLDDSYSLGTTNPHTGHKEYYLGKMFDGLNNIFKPIKDSMTTTPQTPIPTQTSTSMHEEQPREGHGWGDMIGMPTLSGIKNAASTLGTGAYNAASTLGNAAYGVGKGVYNVGSTLGNAAYNAAYGTPPAPTLSPTQGYVQSGMRKVAGTLGGVLGGLGGQIAGQKVGQNLGAGIPIIGSFVSPITGNITGNIGYNVGTNKGKNKGIELADRFYNYISGNNPVQSNSNTSSRFPTFSNLGNSAYNTVQKFGNAAYGVGKNIGNAAYNAASGIGKGVYNIGSTLGNAAYNNFSTLPKLNNPFRTLVSTNLVSQPNIQSQVVEPEEGEENDIFYDAQEQQ
jgi:hypothetical protein